MILRLISPFLALALLLLLLQSSAHLEDLSRYEILEEGDITKVKSRVKRQLSGAPEKLELEFRALERTFRLRLEAKLTGIFTRDFQAIEVTGDGREKAFEVDRKYFKGQDVGSSSPSHTDVDAYFEDKDEKDLIATIDRGEDGLFFVEPVWRHLSESERERANATRKLHSSVVYSSDDLVGDNNDKEDLDAQRRANTTGSKRCEAEEVTRELMQTASSSSINETSSPPLPATSSNDLNHNSEFVGSSRHKHKRTKRQIVGASTSRSAPRPDGKVTCSLLLVADYLFHKNIGNNNVHQTTLYMAQVINRVNKIFRTTKWQDGNKRLGAYGFAVNKVKVHTEFTTLENSDKRYQYLQYNVEIPPGQPQPVVRQLLEMFSRDHATLKQYCLGHLFTYRVMKDSVLGLAYIASEQLSLVGGICSKEFDKHGFTINPRTGWSSYQNAGTKKPILARQADLVTAHELAHNWGGHHDDGSSECSPSKDGNYLMNTYSVSGTLKNHKKLSPCSIRSIVKVLVSKANLCFSDEAVTYCGDYEIEGDEECDAGYIGLNDKDPCCNKNCTFRTTAACSDMNEICCKDCKAADNSTQCSGDVLLDATCLGVSHCLGTEPKCGKPMFKADNTTCIDHGSCKEGRCVPYCETNDKISCYCEDSKEACSVCCKDSPGGHCQLVIPRHPLQEHHPCGKGVCVPSSEDETVLECEEIVQDLGERLWKVIANIDINQFIKMIRNNIVGSVVIFTLILWIPPCLLINRFDRQEEKIREEEAAELLAEFNDEFNELNGNDLASFGGINNPSLDEHVGDIPGGPGPTSLYSDSSSEGAGRLYRKNPYQLKSSNSQRSVQSFQQPRLT